jgi:hypothetical protein
MVVTLFGVFWAGEMEIRDKYRSAPFGISEALALKWERGLGRAFTCMSWSIYTNSKPWQMWVVPAFWPERTKSSIGLTPGKLELMLELISFHI